MNESDPAERILSRFATVTDGPVPPRRPPRRPSAGSLGAGLTALAFVVVMVTGVFLLIPSAADPRSAGARSTGAPDPSGESSIPPASVSSSAAPSASASASPTAVAPPTVPPLESNELSGFGVSPIPPDAPEAQVTEAQAVDIVRDRLNIPPEAEPHLVEHGVGMITMKRSETVWLVAFQNPDPDQVPYPVGPKCPGEEAQCNWAIDDYFGAFVSDQTGTLLKSFVQHRPVDAAGSPPP